MFETIAEFLLNPFDARTRRSLKEDRELVRALQPRYDALLNQLDTAPHGPEQSQMVLAWMVITEKLNATIPKDRRHTPYWTRVDQMRRTLSQCDFDRQPGHWFEVAIPLLEELLGAAPQE